VLRSATEAEVRLAVGQRVRPPHAGECPRVPGNGCIDVLERAALEHECLPGGGGFFGRAPVVVHAAGQALVFQVAGGRDRREQRRRAEQVMTAALAVTGGVRRVRLRQCDT
jgi:hypothetical protein